MGDLIFSLVINYTAYSSLFFFFLYSIGEGGRCHHLPHLHYSSMRIWYCFPLFWVVICPALQISDCESRWIGGSLKLGMNSQSLICIGREDHVYNITRRMNNFSNVSVPLKQKRSPKEKDWLVLIISSFFNYHWLVTTFVLVRVTPANPLLFHAHVEKKITLYFLFQIHYLTDFLLFLSFI